MLVAGAGGAGVNMDGGGRAFSYEVDGMSMDDEIVVSRYFLNVLTEVEMVCLEPSPLLM